MSVADSLRAEQIERMRQLDASARVDLAYQLGHRDLGIPRTPPALRAPQGARHPRVIHHDPEMLALNNGQ